MKELLPSTSALAVRALIVAGLLATSSAALAQQPDAGADTGDAASRDAGKPAADEPTADDQQEQGAEEADQEADQEAEDEEAAHEDTAEDEDAADADQDAAPRREDQQQEDQEADQPEPTTGEQPATPPPPPPPATGEDTEEKEKAEDAAAEGGRQADQTEQAAEQEGDQETEEGAADESPIADLAEKTGDDFEPVKDIEEEDLQELQPAKVYPYLEWDGMFRLRSAAAVNFDLGTGGTSAVRAPAENHLPAHAPADPDSDLLWGTDLDLRLDPTVHITERLSVHVEAQLLDNLVLGSLSQTRVTQPSAVHPDPSRTVHSSNQISPRELDWFENAIRINEAYGSIHSALGTLEAGRMDWDWGLGMYANGGDCADCDFGDHVDRIRVRTPKIFSLYGSAAIDFPDQGVTSQTPSRPYGQPYDMAQIDDARQYTFTIFNKPLTEKDLKLREQRLEEEGKPVIDGGALFTFRTQQGAFIPSQDAPDQAGGQQQAGTDGGRLVYRGLDMYVPDLWFRFQWKPADDRLVRVELEANGVFGSIDNATSQQVGDARDDDNDVNCFDEDTRNANFDQCTNIRQNGELVDTTEGISQFGAALESEFYLGGPVRFGLNSGLATGGDSPNWGYAQSGRETMDFYRFDPNYHVDLILFREVIGTVTNAFYANPYAQARFFEGPDQRLELQLDAIASRVLNTSGTPSGQGDWLGLEFDGAVRYLQIGTFQAELEGGILFPFQPLDSEFGRRRLTGPPNANQEFTDSVDASLAWTIQGNLIWKF